MSQTFWTWVPRVCICTPHAGGGLKLGQCLKPWDLNSTLSKLRFTSLLNSFSRSLLSLSLSFYGQCQSRDFFLFLLSFSSIYFCHVGLWAPGNRDSEHCLLIVTPWRPVCPMGQHSLVSSEGWTNEQITHNTETSPSVAPVDVLHI